MVADPCCLVPNAASAPTDTPSVRIEDCNIRKAVASGVSAGAGGALFLDDQSSGLIRGSGFSECAADIAGGVVAVAAGTRLTILGSFFTDNRAVGDGGVFAVPANSGLVQLSISGSKFELNKARRGGVMAVLATRALVARIVNSSFTLNSASFGGLGYLDPRSNIVSLVCCFLILTPPSCSSSHLLCISCQTWSGVRFRFNSATAGWGDHLLLSMPAVPNHAVNLCPPSDALPGVFAEAGDNKTLVTEFSRVVQPVNSKTFIPSNPVPLQLLLVDCFGNVVRGFEVAPLITVFSDAECVGSIHNFQMSTAAAIGDLTIQLEFLKQPRNGGASCRLAVVVDVPHLVTYATLFVRPCNPGFGLDPQLLECSKCNTGTYFSNNGSACLQCPANAQCLTGTAAVANVEYWLNERDVATFRCEPALAQSILSASNSNRMQHCHGFQVCPDFVLGRASAKPIACSPALATSTTRSAVAAQNTSPLCSASAQVRASCFTPALPNLRDLPNSSRTSVRFGLQTAVNPAPSGSCCCSSRSGPPCCSSNRPRRRRRRSLAS